MVIGTILKRVMKSALLFPKIVSDRLPKSIVEFIDVRMGFPTLVLLLKMVPSLYLVNISSVGGRRSLPKKVGSSLQALNINTENNKIAVITFEAALFTLFKLNLLLNLNLVC